ncbi:MAG: hypothetical protein WA637_19230, partial [Terriglobales bacterium]
GNSATTVCFKLVNHAPLAVTAFNSQLPPELDSIVSRAIAKDPDQRYQTGMELANDIRELRGICGLVQKTDSSVTSVKADATSRDVPSVARASRGQKSENMPAKESVAGLDPNIGVQPTRYWPKWNGLLLSALFAIVIGFVTLSAINRGHLQGSQAQKTETEAGSMSSSVGVGSVDSKSALISLAPADGTLQIQIQHRFTKGWASVWLDNRLVYTHSLHGEIKSRALVFQRMEGRQSATIGVPTGEHEVRVRIQSAADHYDQSKTMDGAFAKDRQSALQIFCPKKPGELRLTFRP